MNVFPKAIAQFRLPHLFFNLHATAPGARMKLPYLFFKRHPLARRGGVPNFYQFSPHLWATLN